MINKEIIAQRKEQYGNNFPLISKLFNNYLQNIKNVDIVLTPEDISILMALMKISRLANSPDHADSLIDLINYMWIALNYDEYASLGRIDELKSPYMNINKNDFDVDRMIRNINNLTQNINKTEHNSGNAIDIPRFSFADFVLAYIKTKPLD
ncbi:MAG: DUF6378 domain-containing protein [Dysgonamonadaceae bacterium]|nr:DUF6378 domain-containing protein [Dysgonamonadaceae bacterium]